jgi:hypothetical protein
MMNYALPVILAVAAICLITSLVQFGQTFRYLSQGQTARGTVTLFVRTQSPDGTIERRNHQKSRPQIEFIDHHGVTRSFIGKQVIGLSASDEVDVYYLPSDGESGSPKTKAEIFVVPTAMAVFGLLLLLMYFGMRNQISKQQKLFAAPEAAVESSLDEDVEDTNRGDIDDDEQKK